MEPLIPIIRGRQIIIPELCRGLTNGTPSSGAVTSGIPTAVRIIMEATAIKARACERSKIRRTT